MAIPRLRPWSGPAILSYGFRPFFFLGAIYAALAVLVWVPVFAGQFELGSSFAPVDWHAHEMLFGFLGAIVGGFLLTSVPNWTGRLPVQGLPLLALVMLWAGGRIAMLLSAQLGPLATAVVDLGFLAALGAAAAIEIVSGGNWRNLKVLFGLGLLLAANLAFHIEVYLTGTSDHARRLGFAGALMLIMLIGGRIVPSFTRNWLARERPGRLPVPFGRPDMLAVAAATAALLLWVVVPDFWLTGLLMALAALAHVWRLTRWAGDRAIANPLVLILHAAYAFVPLGFALIAAASIWPELIYPAAGIHALGAGAIGTMTLAVMTRASLGHTGRPLVAGPATCLVYLAVIASAVLRVFAATAWGDGLGPAPLYLAAVLWVVAFGGFALAYGPALHQPRLRTAL